MRILKNNYRPIILRKHCEYCDSLIELDFERDIINETAFRMQGEEKSKNGKWTCSCCNKSNIIKDFYE